MMRALILSGLLIAVAGCGSRPPAASRAELMSSEAVKTLKADDSPYRIIYSPPADLAKKPAPGAPTTSGPASPRRK
jgi:hypothetical protein